MLECLTNERQSQVVGINRKMDWHEDERERKRGEGGGLQTDIKKKKQGYRIE